MRILWALLFCMSASIINAQFYITDVASLEIDQLQSDFKNLKLKHEFGESKIKLDALGHYWSSVISKGSPSSSAWQNYYYCKIQENYKRFLPESNYSNLLENVLALKVGMQRVLPDDNPIWGLYYDKLASLYKSTRDYKTSRKYYEQAINNLELDSCRIRDKLRVLSWLAALELKLGNNQKALEIYSLVIEKEKELQPVDSISLAYVYYNISRYYERTTDYENHAKYLNKSAKIIYNHFGEENKFYWFIQIGRGFNLYNRGRYESALEVFFFLDKKYTLNESESSKIANNKKWIANCYRKLNHLEKAKEIYTDLIHYYKSKNQTLGLTAAYNELSLVTHSNEEKIVLLNKALSVCDKDDYCDPRNKAIILKNLAIEYRKSGDLLKGLNYLNKALEIEKTHKDKYVIYPSYTYSSLSIISDNLGNLEKATAYAVKALESHRDESKSNYEREAFLQANLAYFLIKSNELIKAENILNEAMQNLNKAPTNTYNNKANVFKQTVYLYKEKKEYEKALKLNQKSLEAYSLSMGKRSEYYSQRLIQKADLFRLMGKPDSCKVILKQAYIDVGLADEDETILSTSDIPQAYLWLAFNTLNSNMNLEIQLDSLQPISVLANKVEVGCRLIDGLRKSYYFESSEQNFIITCTSFLDRAIELLYKLYNKEPDEKIIALIFKCIEKSKSISINRAFERSKSIMEKGVPLEMIKKEKRIISDFERSFKMFADYTEEGEDLKAAEESRIMFSLQSEKDNFLDSLKRTYPKYYNRRYAQSLITLDEFKDIAKKQDRGFLQYHLTSNDLYKLYVYKGGVKFSKLPNDEILSLIDNLNSSLVSADVICDENLFHENRTSFISNSAAVYDIIIGDEIGHDLPFHLTIIPDGLLNGLSFDVLIKNNVDTDISFRSLMYLIKDHSISYVGSASQFARLQDFRKNIASSNYVGFAPSYPGSNNKEWRLGSSDLLHNTEEIKLSSAYFDGDKFLGADATETRFKEVVSHYRIAHLALHGIINDTFPLNSYLQFVEGDSLDDGKLFVHEITELEINNSLMVLSACQTNTGKEIKGEGLLGISRAFQIASCPNILVSNWLVDDKSASRLMQSFFERISNNRSPADALREAKLEFINSSSQVNSHPTYWAAFSYYGNPNQSVRYRKSFSDLILWIGGGIVLFLIFSMFYKNRAVK